MTVDRSIANIGTSKTFKEAERLLDKCETVPVSSSSCPKCKAKFRPTIARGIAVKNAPEAAAAEREREREKIHFVINMRRNIALNKSSSYDTV